MAGWAFAQPFGADAAAVRTHVNGFFFRHGGDGTSGLAAPLNPRIKTQARIVLDLLYTKVTVCNKRKFE
jgi:hypothetical protein